MTLSKIISNLVMLAQEGGYWDFKRQWHEDKTSLLHDIICMANNLHNRDAYIIIGVDEEDNFAIVDVRTDPNRRNTQKIVTFLRDKKFAGGIRPLVHVEQISIFGKEVDVIVIENSKHTPYYLTEQFEGVRANHIYTRVMDANTGRDKSADINHVEYLWRKRFCMDEMPIDKFRYFLKNATHWEAMHGSKEGYFYKYAPEYTICREHDERTGYEYYIFGQVDTRPSWWTITLKYYQTPIAQVLGLALDGGRSFVIAPERAYGICQGVSGFGYFIEDSLQHRLLNFYREKENVEIYSYNRFIDAVLIFKSTYEYERFLSYIKTNISIYEDLYKKQGDEGLPYFPKKESLLIDDLKKEYKDALVMKKMQEDFRKDDTLQQRY